MRVFFDTNVLASALMGHGPCRDLLDRAVIGHSVLPGKPVFEEALLNLIKVNDMPILSPRQLWTQLTTIKNLPTRK